MVTRYSSRASGIQVTQYYWGIIAKGTREMLIQHGFTQDSLFPGDAGAKKISLTAIDPAGRTIKINRTSKYLFDVRRHWCDEEKAAYEQRLEHDKEIENAKRLVASWPASPNKFREDSQFRIELGLRLMEDGFSDGRGGGYRFDDGTIDRVRFLADQLRGLVDSGTIVKDLALRELHTPACIAKSVQQADAAKRDKTFQQFMDGVKK